MSERKDSIDAIFEEYEKSGGLQDLPGKGKPIPEEALKGDVLNGILKNANYVPAWVEQQQLIAAMIRKAIQSFDSGHHQEGETLVAQVNEAIRKYNRSCPPIMQRGLVVPESLRDKLALWEA
ncbi:DnaJ family domain-containing protein [Paenibacillus marinisediminis]